MKNLRKDKKGNDRKGQVKKALAKAAVLAAGIMLGTTAVAACSPEYNITLIPYEEDAGVNPENCLQNNDAVLVAVEACNMISEPEVREGDILVIGTAGIEASMVVDVGSTKGIRVNGLDEEAGCTVVDTQDIVPGETRVVTVGGELHQVELVSLEYDSVGARMEMNVTPGCYEPVEE